MVEKTTLKVKKRDRAGKGASRAVRREGFLPGVIYGNKQDPVLFFMDPRDLLKEAQKKGFYTRQFQMDVEGDKHLTMCQDIQMHPVKDTPIHVDFMRIDLKKELVVEVPISCINEETSPGLKQGGVLNIVRREIEVKCRPDNISQEFEIDLSTLEIGDSVHIQDLKLPEGVQLPDPEAELTVLTIVAPTVMKETTEEVAETEAGAEGDAKPAEADKDKEKKAD